MGFEPMTSVIPVWCSTDWAKKCRQKQVRCKFNLYPLYQATDIKRMMWSVYEVFLSVCFFLLFFLFIKLSAENCAGLMCQKITLNTLLKLEICKTSLVGVHTIY